MPRTILDWHQILAEERAKSRQMKVERNRELKDSLDHVRSIYGRLEDADVRIKEVYDRLDAIEESLIEIMSKYNG